MVLIRDARDADAPAMLDIYRPYVEQSAVSFEEVAPPLEEFAARLRKYRAGWVAIVAAGEDDAVLGYAYGSSLRERAAYRWSVETTVYVAPGVQRQGVGRRLYGALMPRLSALGYCNAYAAVALPNAASEGLHRAAGFTCVGVFPRVGYKFGRWHDMAWYHLPLRAAPPDVPSFAS